MFCGSFVISGEILSSFKFHSFLVSITSNRGNCRYVGNIHTQVTEPLLQEVFASTGLVEGCKLVRKEKVR